jgi:hypothetical protein
MINLHRHIVSLHSLLLIALLFSQVTSAGAQQSAPSQSPDTPTTDDAAKALAAQPAKVPDAAGRPAPTGEGIPARVIDGGQVMGVLGKQVRSSAGEDMGRIVDVIIDRSARVRAAVIDFGGFLGVGNRQIAVAWSAIRLPAEDKPGALVVDFTRDQLRVAPAYKAGEQVVLLGQAETPPAAATTGAADKDAPPKEVPKEPQSK